MTEDDTSSGKPVLPGNHGQFGTNVMTEESEVLESDDAPPVPADRVPEPSRERQQTQGPKQTGAGERS